MTIPEQVVAPVAPDAPASAPAPAITPDSPSSDALSQALASFANGVTDQMRTPEPQPGEQPRDEKGRFTATEATLDGGDAPTDLPPSDQPPAAEPTAETPPPAAEASTEVGADDDIDPELVIELMPRHPHEAPVPIAVDSKEVADRLRQTLKGAMRREEYESAMQQVEERVMQAEEQETRFLLDPVRAVQETLSPEQTDLLLLALLTDDRVHERLADKLPDLLDDTSRKLLRADVREAYVETREQARGQLEQSRAVARNLRETKAAVEAIIPDHLNEAQREFFRRDALRELSVVCKQRNIRLLDPLAIPTALNARLAAYGVEQTVAADRIATALGRKPTAAPPASAGVARAASPSALPSASPRASTPTPGARPVQELRAAHGRRAAAAATAGVGVGTPAAGGLPSLPQGAGLDEAIALMRQRTAR